jgi:c-di-GMP-binding flagellar brake protein YcgR
MTLKALVFCSDDKIVRVLRRVLSDLEIGVEHCVAADDAIHKLTRQRFEAVIVDFDDAHVASQVLKGARLAPCNKKAVAVAIVDGQKGLRSVFDMGAHFVLYKPLSAERAKTSFRAARSLMKRERRRNTRVPVEIPVMYSRGTPKKNGALERTLTTDIGEGGMAIRMGRRPQESGPILFRFTLPGAKAGVEVSGEVAWDSGSQVGIRFINMSSDLHDQLKNWIGLATQAPEEKDDPPVSCKLTDLTLGGCYLESDSPFPVRTRVELCMRAADLEVRVEGIIRVMHPEAGMGVEFTQKTEEQRAHVENFIHALTSNHGVMPELLVEPEGLESDNDAPAQAPSLPGEVEDSLVELFRHKGSLPADEFLAELRRQRNPELAEPPEPAVLG